MELVVILLIALVVVGPQRLPDVGRTIGKAMREFKKAQDEIKGAISFDLDTEPEPRRPAPHRPRPSVVRDAETSDGTPSPQPEPDPRTAATEALEAIEAEDRAENPEPAADTPAEPE